MPATLSTADLPLAELMCARLDGEVYPLGECWCPIDEIDSPNLRAASLAPLLPRRAIIERHSAAWVYDLCPEPAQHEFCVDLGARTHAQPSPRRHLREVVCPTDDTAELGGVRVTTPIRTAIDLARWAAPNADDHLLPLLFALLRYGGFTDTTQARARCEARSIPHRGIALRRLAAVETLLRSD
ncbi:hypothetical protein GY21_05975 [Cryobacterium roopkundense]|nr:hypothetical protein GY21_05975 [Cryobacterium roopkundense]